MTTTQWNTVLCVTTIVMTLAAGGFALAWNRADKTLKGIKAKNPTLDITGLTEAQIKYFNSLKVS